MDDDHYKEKINKRLCADTTYAKVKNSYLNHDDRVSFSLDVIKCQGPTCAKDDDI